MAGSQKQGRILVVDDNPHICESLALLLRHDFREIITCNHPPEALALIEEQDYDLVLLDMNFTTGASHGKEGLVWLKKILASDPQVMVVLITAFGDVELAVQGMKEGAADFILKPWNPEKLITNLKQLLHMRQTQKKLDRYQTHVQSTIQNRGGENPSYQCQSPAMKVLYEAIAKVAPTDANILITGENGTGKEVIARDIHGQSRRGEEIFVALDLGSLPESLFESELFGHLKGSFTGAHQDKKGRFEIAHKGSLLLDEIGNISLAMQARLLSVIEKKQLIPLGGVRPLNIDVRLITATNANIPEMTKRGAFREDLFYRINTISLHIPPLRQRPEDIEGLCLHFLQEYSRKYRKPGLDIAPRAWQRLKVHAWPGNVRELKHTMEKAVILCENQWLRPEDFFLRQPIQQSPAPALNLQQMEQQAIEHSLERHQGNLSQVARQLGITRATLYAKMRKYGL